MKIGVKTDRNGEGEGKRERERGGAAEVRCYIIQNVPSPSSSTYPQTSHSPRETRPARARKTSECKLLTTRERAKCRSMSREIINDRARRIFSSEN